MTQESKELLLRDLCARLPYGVNVNIINAQNEHRTVKLTPYNFVYVFEIGEGWWKECKPYLHSLSSMTEEEREELKELCSIYIPAESHIAFEDYGLSVFTHHISDDSYTFKIDMKAIDWLNAHHFDYRGLIDKGLALEAPEGMYN